ncbi:hypothetical protein ACXR2U_09070 [Jatrophihabitans sp. YIM 134969]
MRTSMRWAAAIVSVGAVVALAPPANAGRQQVTVDVGCQPSTLGRGALVTGRETDVFVSVLLSPLDEHDTYTLAWPTGADARTTALHGAAVNGTLERRYLPVRLDRPLADVGTRYQVRNSSGRVVASGDLYRAVRPDADCRVLSTLQATRTPPDPSGLNAFSLAQQTDGNVVERNGQGRALWTTGTAGHPGAHLVLQSDGNVVIRDAAGRAVWNTGTAGHPGATLTLQADSNVVLRDPAGRALWASGLHR